LHLTAACIRGFGPHRRAKIWLSGARKARSETRGAPGIIDFPRAYTGMLGEVPTGLEISSGSNQPRESLNDGGFGASKLLYLSASDIRQSNWYQDSLCTPGSRTRAREYWPRRAQTRISVKSDGSISRGKPLPFYCSVQV